MSRRLRLMAVLTALLAGGCTLGPSLPEGGRVLTEVAYVERDGRTLTGRLFLPPEPAPRPGVLLVYGGGWDSGAPEQMAHLGRRLAGAGFVAFAPQYRHAPEHTHPGQLADLRAALDWLAERPEVDGERLGAWGYSAGGQLALLLGLAPGAARAAGPEAPRPVAVVAGAPPTDFELFDADAELLVQYLGASRKAAPEQWEQAAPASWVSPDDPPVFLYHGRDDAVVDLAHSRRLAASLERAEIPVTLDEVFGGHIWVFVANREVEARATAFLVEQLDAAEGEDG